jgi:hypothetical protein
LKLFSSSSLTQIQMKFNKMLSLPAPGEWPVDCYFRDIPYYFCVSKGFYEGQSKKRVPLNRDIYPNLKLRIYTAGIRQNRLAKMIGIDEAYLSKIINGFREPSENVRESIAEALNSDPDWLFQKIQISSKEPFAEHRTESSDK